MNFLKFLLFFIIAVEGSVHICQNDQSKVDVKTVPLSRAKSSKATGDSFQPIRFGKYVFAMPSVTQDKKVILDRLFDETIQWMSSYLKVIPNTSPIKLSVPSTYLDNHEPPAEHRNPGISDIDFLLYFIEADCSSIANAQYLQADTNGQPYIGLVRVCKNLIDVSNELYYKTVLLHEITHALGFSNTVFKNMKDASNNNYLKTKTTSDGINRSILTTPKVTSFIRKHFECDTIEGAYLENDGGSGTAGSHWESTSYNYELMTGWISSTKINILTNMTLNWLEDTNWYKVNYTYANTWMFGYKKGCEMAELQCSKTVDNKVIPNGDYCEIKKDDQNHDLSVCTIDYEAVGHCTQATGNDCPLVAPWSNRLCKDESNNNGQGNNLVFGIEYSPTSYCHNNFLILNRYVEQKEMAYSCFRTKCNSDNTYSLVLCNNENGCISEDDYVKVKCSRKGEVVKVNGFKGNVTCNDPSIICGGKIIPDGDDNDDDDDYTGTDENGGGGGNDDGVVTKKPTNIPKPITPTAELDDRSSNYVVCVVLLLFIVAIIM